MSPYPRKEYQDLSHSGQYHSRIRSAAASSDKLAQAKLKRQEQSRTIYQEKKKKERTVMMERADDGDREAITWFKDRHMSVSKWSDWDALLTAKAETCMKQSALSENDKDEDDEEQLIAPVKKKSSRSKSRQNGVVADGGDDDLIIIEHKVFDRRVELATPESQRPEPTASKSSSAVIPGSVGPQSQPAGKEPDVQELDEAEIRLQLRMKAAERRLHAAEAEEAKLELMLLRCQKARR